MTEFNFEIARPWVLLIVIPALILGIIVNIVLNLKKKPAANDSEVDE